MANSATELGSTDRVSIGFTSSPGYNGIITYQCLFDNASNDLLVHTPATGKRWGIVGINYSINGSHTFVIKSGSTTIISDDISNGGMSKGVGSGDGLIAYGVAKGDTLSLRFNTLYPAYLYLQVIEFENGITLSK